MIPRGISPGRSERAIVSQKMTNTAPMRIVAGTVSCALAPNKRRATWGMMRPTHPITPPTAVTAAMAATAAIKSNALSRPIRDPREKAVSSLKESKFKRQRMRNMMINPMVTKGSISSTSRQVTLHNPPSSQNVISGSWVSGSERYLSSPIPAANRAETAMPERIRRRTQPP